MEKPLLTVVMSVVTIFLCAAQVTLADPDKTKDAQSHSDNTDQKVEKSTAPKADDAKSDSAADNGESRQQVQAWFAQYDQIRRDAEMTLQEKLQSHGLFTKGLEGTQSASQGDRSSRFATTMAERYADASTSIKGLPELTATADLQKGYSEFFTKCSNLFHEYLTLQNSSGNKKDLKAKLLSNKEKLTALDKKDKALDAELRSHYGVKAHKHK